MEARDQPPGLLPRRAVARRVRRGRPASARRRCARAGSRRGSACPRAGSSAAIGRGTGSPSSAARAGQAELGEAARRGRRRATVAVAAEARDQAAAQVVAQHRAAERARRRTTPPRARRCRPAARARPSATASNHAGLRLPHAACGRTESRRIRVSSRNGVSPSVASNAGHRRESSKPRAQPPPVRIALPAAPVRAGRCHPCRAAGAHLAARPGREVRADLGHRQGRARLLEGLPGVEFVEYDKKHRPGRHARPACELRSACGAAQRFDALLQMQVAARANLLSAFIPADAADRLRPHRVRRTCTGCSSTSASRTGPASTCSMRSAASASRWACVQTEVRWDLPVPDDAREWARAQWPDDGTPTLLVSPCSSHVLRNWRADRYAAVADHAAVARLARRAVRRPQRAGARRPPTRSSRRCTRPAPRPGRQGHAQATAGAARARRPGDDAGFRADAHRQRDGHEGAGPACGQQSARAAARTRTCATASTATTMRRASTWASPASELQLGHQDRARRRDGPGDGRGCGRGVRALPVAIAARGRHVRPATGVRAPRRSGSPGTTSLRRRPSPARG